MRRQRERLARRVRRRRAWARSPARSAPTRTSTRRRGAGARRARPRARDVATQVVARDRHAACSAAMRGAGARRAVRAEVRHLQRTEVREARGAVRRRPEGRSAMPHKRNPIVSESICGLARVVRAERASPPSRTWRSGTSATSRTRRSSASSCPTRPSPLDYMLDRARRLIEGLVVYPERMLREPGGVARPRLLGPRAPAPGRVAACPARRRTSSCSAARCAPGTDEGRCATCSRPTPRSRPSCAPPTSTRFFDLDALLVHVDEIIDRTLRRPEVAHA